MRCDLLPQGNQYMLLAGCVCVCGGGGVYMRCDLLAVPFGARAWSILLLLGSYSRTVYTFIAESCAISGALRVQRAQKWKHLPATSLLGTRFLAVSTVHRWWYPAFSMTTVAQQAVDWLYSTAKGEHQRVTCINKKRLQ